VQNRVVWRIKRKNPLKGLTCGWVKEKKAYINKNFCVYFTHLPRNPPWRNLHKILHDGSPLRRNQPCQILSQSGQGFWFCEGSNFWIPHKKEKSPLTRQSVDGSGVNIILMSRVRVTRGVKKAFEIDTYHSQPDIRFHYLILFILKSKHLKLLRSVHRLKSNSIFSYFALFHRYIEQRTRVYLAVPAERCC